MVHKEYMANKAEQSVDERAKLQQDQRCRDPNFQGGIAPGMPIGACATEVARESDVSEFFDALNQLIDEAGLTGDRLHEKANRLYGERMTGESEKAEAPVRAGQIGNIDSALRALKVKLDHIREAVNRFENLV